jgi:hypothetical protein
MRTVNRFAMERMNKSKKKGANRRRVFLKKKSRKSNKKSKNVADKARKTWRRNQVQTVC